MVTYVSTSLDFKTTIQTSRGKLTDFPYTTAGSTLPALDGYGFRYLTPTHPTFAPQYPVSVRQLIRLLHTAFRSHLTMTPLCFTILHLHQVGKGTSTLLVRQHARHASCTTGIAGSLNLPPKRGQSYLPKPGMFKYLTTFAALVCLALPDAVCNFG